MTAEAVTLLIQEHVAKSFRLTRDQLLSRRRKREFSYPRMLAMYLVRELTRQSYPWIAHQFGGFDHTSVLYACRWAHDNGQYREYIRETIERFGGRCAIKQ
jgi:chromosomal replication initiation ATPase DnaA